MLCSRFRRRLAATDGFTLVELLVVVLIIGVLASIAMSAFLNQRGKAQDTSAKGSATTAAKAMLVFNSERNSFDGATPAALVKIEPSLDKARGLDVESDETTFTVTVDSAAGGGARFAIERLEEGQLVRTCTKPGTGSCLTDADALGNRW
jgi:type IV pilus assembly protein PilA